MEGLKIKSCFIFNLALKSPKAKPTDDEAQDAKLLFYYPQDEELLIKRSNIGIIEGTLSFMSSFQKTNTQFLLTELNKFYYVANNYESDFIIVFILEKNTPMFNYYHNIETKKSLLKSFLDNYYNTFILFHNSLTNFFLSPNTPHIALETQPKNKISAFLDFTISYISQFETMKIPLNENVIYFPIRDDTQSNILLAVQRLNEKIPDMVMSAIVYKGHIIHNQLPLGSFSLLYNVFYNVFNSQIRYNKFKQPQHEVIQSININSSSSTSNTNDKQNDNHHHLYSNEINNNDTYLFNNESPFSKAFELIPDHNDFLIGIQKGSGNNYNVFIPSIYIRELNSSFKLLVYHYNGMNIFMFLKESFNIHNQLTSTLVNVSKWVEKYFVESIFEELETVYEYRMSRTDELMYIYLNNANKSLKISKQFYNKKDMNIETERIDLIQRIFSLHKDVEMTSISKYKGCYIYYLNSCERNLIMLFGDNMSIAQVMKNIENAKNTTFDSIYMI